MQAVKVTHIDPKCEKIEEIISNLVSYSALFDLWKSKDLQELVDGMMQSAEQSWIIFITSKEAIKVSRMLNRIEFIFVSDWIVRSLNAITYY